MDKIIEIMFSGFFNFIGMIMLIYFTDNSFYLGYKRKQQYRRCEKCNKIEEVF